jgi:hypothetical protein
VPLPTHAEEERFEVIQLAMPGFYRVICHVGYTDSLPRDSSFLDLLLQSIVRVARFKALIAK